MNRFIALLALGVAAAPAAAQIAPEIGSVYPPGGRRGTTVAVALGGAEWTPDMQFFAHDPRVKLEAAGPLGELLIPPPPYWFGAKGRLSALPLLRERAARLTLPAGLPPGPIRWQAANANGVTAAGIFIVGAGPEVLEDEKNRGDQILPALPITVNGRLRKNEEVDRYRFKAAITGPITLELTARRLGSNFNGAIEVYDAKHAKVAEAVDTEGNDPALTFAAAAGVEYTVAIHDIDHAGDRSFTYRLEVRPGPRIVGTLPACGQRGSKREVEFLIDHGSTRLASLKKTVEFPALGGTDLQPVQVIGHRREVGATQELDAAYRFPLSDIPESVFPGKLSIPGAITGILDKPNAEAKFALVGKKGDRWSIRGEAHRYGSPIDPALKLLGPDGKQLAANDDLPGTTDAGLEFTVPASGTYQLVLTDGSGSAGTRRALYRVSVRIPADGFTLHAAAQKLSLPLGAKTTLNVKAARTGNFKGPIALTLTGLPAGVVAMPTPLVLPADKSDLAIVLDVPANSATSAALVTISGTATVAGKPMTRLATAAHSATVGNLAPRSAADKETTSLLLAITMKPRVKGAPVDKDTGRKVPRGSTHPADITLERLEGYAGEITLHQAARQSYQVQGITGRDVIVPPTSTKAAYPCFMPEWLETSRTSRMGIVAEVKLADPKGNVRTLVAPIAGFVTMTMEGALLKLSHAEGEVAGKSGQSIVVKVRLARSPRLTEPVKLELIAPEELTSALKCKPVLVAAGATEAVLRIEIVDASRLVGEPAVTVRGTAIQPGDLKIVSETAVKLIPTK